MPLRDEGYQKASAGRRDMNTRLVPPPDSVAQDIGAKSRRLGAQVKRLVIMVGLVVFFMAMAASAAEASYKYCNLYQSGTWSGVYCKARAENYAYYYKYDASTWKSTYATTYVTQVSGANAQPVSQYHVFWNVFSNGTDKGGARWDNYSASLPDSGTWSGLIKSSKGNTKYKWYFACRFNDKLPATDPDIWVYGPF